LRTARAQEVEQVPEPFSPEDYSADELVTVFRSRSRSAEVEAESIYGLLQSADMKSLIVRENVPELPTGWVEVKVLASDAEEARQLIQSAQQGNLTAGEEPSE
jgi:Putative prokaryotic signal transducing protein